MRYLTLVRHGQAEWKAPPAADFDRPLTRRGLTEVAAMARRLHQQESSAPGLVLTSPAARAAQTAEVIAQEFGIASGHVQRLDSLYLASAAALESVIRGTGPRITHLLLVGHNPGLGELAVRLAPQAGIGSFEAGACCRLAFEAPDWASIGTAAAADYEAPRQFPGDLSSWP